jgi:hypothetical protein
VILFVSTLKNQVKIPKKIYCYDPTLKYSMQVLVKKMGLLRKAEKLPNRALACALFGPPARFGHFLFTKSQIVEEMWVKFHSVIVGLRRDYKVVVE